MHRPIASLHAAVVCALWRARSGGDGGQTTAEYALVLLGAAAVAMLLLAWAAKTRSVGKLFDWVLDQVVGRAS